MLGERKQLVLKAVVDDYILTAVPVGSRTISRKYGLGFSPATIRNEMSDLEELGYLEQPHTSAGRIPSDKGYRFYVDQLMEITRLAEDEMAQIEELYVKRVHEIEKLIQQATKLLSTITSYLAVIVGPRIEEGTFYKLDIVPLGSGKALLIMVTDTGMVEHAILEVSSDIGPEVMSMLSTLFSQKFCGLSIEKIGSSLIRELRHELFKYHKLIDDVLTLLSESITQSKEDQLYIGGTTNILAEPEFRNVDKVRNVLQALEQAKFVKWLLSLPVGANDMVVSIGQEILIQEMQDCSIISAPFGLRKKCSGRIGVIGPKRMNYSKAITAVREVAAALTEATERSLWD